MNPNPELRSSAIALGLCQKWQGEWHDNLTNSQLISMFRRGQDFCIEHDFPPLDYIREAFPESDLRRGGVYLDADLCDPESQSPESALTLGNGTFIFLGSCRGAVRFPRWSAAVLYVRHDSRIRVEADEFSRIQIHLYDSAEAEFAPADPTARVSIFGRR